MPILRLVPVVPRSNHRPGEPNVSLLTAIKATCEAFVDRSPPHRPLGECWETYYMFPYQRRLWHPARLMWSATHTDMALGRLKLVHRCQNPLCVNPEHLWVPALQGDPPDSLVLPEKHTTEEDWAEYDAAFDSQPMPRRLPMRAKARAALTEENVRWIRTHYTGTGTGSASHLAKTFSVSLATVMDVVHRRTWKHVSDTPQARPDEPPARPDEPPARPGEPPPAPPKVEAPAAPLRTAKLPPALEAALRGARAPEVPVQAPVVAPPAPVPVESAEPRRLPRRLWGKVAE